MTRPPAAESPSSRDSHRSVSSPRPPRDETDHHSMISVLIATRNRSAQLRACLESLRVSSLPAGWAVEVIVIDNASTDDTAAVVAALQTPCPDRTFLYMKEARIGKSFA